jgi:hypothetical protein
MSQFTTPLDNRYLDGKRWLLISPFQYHIGTYPAKFESDIITVPEMFVHDFASIPKFLHFILSPTGPYAKAAVIHDYLYRTQTYSRKRADIIFMEGMVVLEVPKWQRVVVYRAVRLFGWNAWRKNKKLLSKGK